MAWVFKHNDRKVWWIGTRIDGKLFYRSTKERDEGKARAMLADIKAMEERAAAKKLNRDFYEALTGDKIEEARLFASLDQWLKETTRPNTHRNYQGFAESFKKALPHDPILSDIQEGQVRKIFAEVKAKVRPSTANQWLTRASAFFTRFAASVRKDPTEGIPRAKRDGTEVEKEPFTVEQIRDIVAVAEPFWRCAAGISFYTGLRLSDVASLKAKNFVGGRLEVATTKTGTKIRVKLPAKLADSLPTVNKNPDDYIWPDKAKLGARGVTYLSREFVTLLKKAGIRKKQAGAGNGITGRRNVSSLTFHSLRHSFVSALANSGVNQQTVKALVGHVSDRINDAYTHIGQETLDKAAAALPDITKEAA